MKMKIDIRKDFRTREEAEEYQDAYYRAYSPNGYGTSLRVLPIDPDYSPLEGKKWAVVGFRYHTAD